MRLALDLGKTLAELRRMPRAEFTVWMAYYLQEAQKRDLAERKASAKAKLSKPRR